VFARPEVSRDDDDREAPGQVVAAAAVGTAPLPIIGVYAVMFLIHGSFHPVQPPDVTGSTTGEFIVGWIALAVFVALTAALIAFLNGRRRWPFAVLQLGILGLCVDFAAHNTVSGQRVSILVALLSAVGLVLAFTPPAWQHVGRPVPGWLTAAWQRRRSPSTEGSEVVSG
jgi:putative copper export protein